MVLAVRILGLQIEDQNRYKTLSNYYSDAFYGLY